MRKFKCAVCGFVYEPEKGLPENGIPPGTPFEALPADFCCPVCGAVLIRNRVLARGPGPPVEPLEPAA